MAASNKSFLTALKPLNNKSLESFVEIVDIDNTVPILSMSGFTDNNISRNK